MYGEQFLHVAASQAATTTTIALDTTYTGLCLSNPAGNKYRLMVRQVGIALSTAPAASSAIGLGGGYSAAGVTVHTTPLTPFSTNLASAALASAKADAAATLVGTPKVIVPMMTWINGQAVSATIPQVVDFLGTIVLMPGAYVFIYTLTVVVGFFSMSWEEVSIA